MVKPKHFGAYPTQAFRLVYESISHVKLFDITNCKTYYIPIAIYEEMRREKKWEGQLAVLARHRLDSRWGRFIRVVDGIDHN